MLWQTGLTGVREIQVLTSLDIKDLQLGKAISLEYAI